MSDFRGVAGITVGLTRLLEGPADHAVPGATVRIGPPEKDVLGGGSGTINVFLYQAAPNPSFRNAELPVRRADGSVAQRGYAALDLNYLLSFYGDDARHVPQLLFGVSVAALHAQPTLTPENIPDSINGWSMKDSGLREQADIVSFSPLPLSYDELSRLWSTFVQVPYVLSLAYRCSVALIEPEMVPEPVLPVRTPAGGVFVMGRPRIDRVSPPTVESEQGAAVRVLGANFGDDCGVWIGDERVASTPVGTGELIVDISAQVPAGVQTLTVVRHVELEGVNGSRPFDEATASLAVRPRIAGEIEIVELRAEGAEEATSVARVPVAPAVHSGQSAELLLNGWPGTSSSARSYALRPAVESSSGPALDFDLAPVAAGQYLARISVGGVASTLSIDEDPDSETFNVYDGPRMSVS